MFKNPFFFAGLIALAPGVVGLIFQKTISLGKSLGPVRIIEREDNAQEFWGYIAFYLILGVLLIGLAATDKT